MYRLDAPRQSTLFVVTTVFWADRSPSDAARKARDQDRHAALLHHAFAFIER